MFVDVRIDDGDLRATLERLDAHISPPGISGFIQGTVEPWHRTQVGERFANEQDPTGKGWAPLSEQAEREREEQGFMPDHPILERTGMLREYLESGGDLMLLPMGASITYPRGQADEETHKKFVVNQDGTMNGRHNFSWKVPARPMLGWTPGDLMTVMTMLEGWVEVGLL